MSAPSGHEQVVQNSGKPHGKNITEGGFDSGAPNASFNNEVRTKKDPARAALNGMQEADVPSAGVQGDRGNKVDNNNSFAATGGDTSA
ncbi:hypothetical protein WHR41_05984 [Cladosporium halotolerans]|uniref:Uncharacterized protein n=1 Tax=Cladosporium halotolerans TaxID=1052096 RepID=A0AB34KQP8_9PEZI